MCPFQRLSQRASLPDNFQILGNVLLDGWARHQNPQNCLTRKNNSKAENAAISKTQKLIFMGSQVPPFFLQSLGQVHTEGISPVLELPKSEKAFSSYVSTKKRSVGYIETCTYTGNAMNHCAVAVSPKCPSHEVWHATPEHFLARPPFWRYGPKYAPMVARQLQ